MNNNYEATSDDFRLQSELHSIRTDPSSGGIFQDAEPNAPEPNALAFTPDGPGVTSYELELSAMRDVCRLLEPLSAESRGRVIDWVGKVLDERRKLEPTPLDLTHMVVKYGMPL
jgi:hypothetical protein